MSLNYNEHPSSITLANKSFHYDFFRKVTTSCTSLIFVSSNIDLEIENCDLK